ncbi:MAG: hypothetical protein QOF61_226 [Acidobacteriota bacterium]|nr:hypothetical protein [Acidobacteriota bacterium]
MKQKIRITVTHEKYVSLGGAGALGTAWCPRCAAIATMLTPDQAAALADVSTRHIFRWLEANRLHFVETETRSPLICLASLPLACEVGDLVESDGFVQGVLYPTREGEIG